MVQDHAKAEKDSQLLADKRKHLTMEKRQKKEQKEEAEKHMAMAADLVGMRTAAGTPGRAHT